MSEELNSDKVYDPQTQKAFDLALKFYQADQQLTRSDRQVLEKLYNRVIYTTLAFGWGSFFALASIPFYRQKLKTGSQKGTHVGRAFILGFVGMVFGAPMGSKYSYNWQVDSLQDSNPRCYEVAKILKPSESLKWMMYYKLTVDHPEHIMKDPRSKEAEIQRNKKLINSRDPMGLYSGPRYDMEQGPSKAGLELAEKEKKEQMASEGYDETSGLDDDPDAPKGKPAAISSWDKIRLQNGLKGTSDSSGGSDGSAWSRIRQQKSNDQPIVENKPVNPFSTNIYKPSENDKNYDDEFVQEQSEFDKLLEKERQYGAQEEDLGRKW